MENINYILKGIGVDLTNGKITSIEELSRIVNSLLTPKKEADNDNLNEIETLISILKEAKKLTEKKI